MMQVKKNMLLDQNVAVNLKDTSSALYNEIYKLVVAKWTFTFLEMTTFEPKCRCVNK